MDPERWKKLESIMLSALELDGEARTEFLEQACSNDPSMRSEVDSMLRANTEAHALQIEHRLLADPASEGTQNERLLGTAVGPYRLDERVGRGGMGDVYRAHREDPYHQVVALKLIRAGVMSDEVLSRFRTEQQVLAQLSHPNITPLLDGGVTDDGLPYLVMKFVEGTAITHYCDEQKLTINQRLELFLTVCSAVQHAHQNLVVHRDLKPSNILVADSGNVQLLDFGIAKLLDSDFTGRQVDQTRSEVRLLTPEYAAPEQVRGQPITTATDVYTLGVLLYELLAGSRPYQLESRTQSEIDRVVCEVEPARPSTMVTASQQAGEARSTVAHRLRRTLEGDLDNIVMMALRKEPERRYASANHIAGDIDRYLKGLPVSARRDTASYRLNKFVRRNRAAVFGVASVLVLTLAYAATTSVQSKRIARQAAAITEERDRAQLAAAKSEELTEFLLGVFDAADPNTAQGADISARELLDRAVESIDDDLAGQDELRGHVLLEMGRVYRRMGLLDKSRELLERSLLVRRQLFGEQHEDIARSLVVLGETQSDAGEFAESDSLFDAGLAMQRELLGDKHITVGITLADIGVLKYYTGDVEEADEALSDAINIMRPNLEDGDHKLISTLSALGVIKLGLNDFASAESLLVEAVAMVDRAGLRKDMTATAARSNLATLYYRRQQYDKAIPIMREVVDIRREVFGNSHQSVATGLNNLAMVMSTTGDPQGAEPLIREALTIQREIGGVMVGRALSGLGTVLVAQEKYPEAETAFQEGLAILVNELGPENTQVKRHHNRMANLYKLWEKPARENHHRSLGAN